ncbi:type I-C CRISPR-associated protein Cas7/Csd2 [Clostridiaceae bacterium]|nr:type I-C CRISPR-associated protein Cas7/Csd2 [Clostridium sp.]NBI73186.1 type I-C CRISPR-associated protein Cas7/Csd2 [Clostridiaceae bacterium]
MCTLKNKIDFLALVSVKNANPNGDPLSGNMPRVTYDGLGEISDVCIKRKIRNRWLDMGESIFVQSDDKRTDEFKSLRDRLSAEKDIMKVQKEGDKDAFARMACEKWLDVRGFGQVFAFTKGKKKDEEADAGGISVGVRGPVSLHPAFSADTVTPVSIQITKSVNSETDAKNPDKKSSDTMGMKHRIDFGLYVVKGSINVQLAEKTGFSEEDAEKLKEALRTLFVNDTSSARPDGSMQVHTLYWWKHNSAVGQYSAAKVHGSIEIRRKDGIEEASSFEDYEIVQRELPGLEAEIIDGV